jgi:Arm DNA-binding domain
MDELSDTKMRNATPADKKYAIADGQGLSVVVRPNGIKLWLYRYRFGGKRKNMSFGTFSASDSRPRAKSATTRKSCLIRAKIKLQCARRSERRTKSSSTASGREEWATTKLEKENKAKSTIRRECWNLAQLNRELGD